MGELRMFLRHAAMILTAALCSLQGSAAFAQAATFEQIVEGAKKEGALTLALLYPSDDATRKKINDAFNQKYGLSLEINWTNVHPYTILQRLGAEAASGKFSFDVTESNAYNLRVVQENGWIKPFPWEKTFGKELPRMGEVAAGVAPEMVNTMLPWRDNVYGIVYNTNEVKGEDIPHNYMDFANEKWRGRVALSNPDLEPQGQLIGILDEAKILGMTKQLLDNQPLLKGTSGAIVAAVSSGEALIGAANATQALLAKQRGEPVGVTMGEDYVFAVPVTIYTPSAPPHPNAAHLFMAWLATEGVYLIDNNPIGTLSDSRTVIGKELGPMVKPEAKVIRNNSSDVFKKIEQVLVPINKMISGMNP